MYKVLVVDDDPWMLEYLSKCIPWKEMNIAEVFEAESGEAAAKVLKEEKVNIVISDVKMGEKDGLQLLKEIKEMDSAIKVILLSGIDSARNVREAFRTGAVDFLFKPVDTDALRKLIKNTTDSIEKEREGTAVTKLIKGDSDVLAILPQWMREKKTKKVYIIKGKFPDEKEKIQKRLGIRGNMAAGILEDELVIIHETDEADDVNFTEELSDEKNICIGISNGFREIHNAKAAYEEALNALDCRFYDKGKKVFYVLDNRDNKMFSLIQHVNLFSNILQAGKYEEAEAVMEQIFAELKKTSLSLGAVHTIQIRFVDAFYHLIDKSNQNPEQVFTGKFALKPHYERLEFRDIEQMHMWITACLKHCIDSLSSDTGSSKRKVIEDIEKMIVENLDKEISLEKIALQLFLNPSYLSRLFKENVGKPYTKYVMEKRIEKAKELLREENYKVYEVGELVGYENTKYFNKIFKEMVGITPKEYREKCRNV